MYKLLIVDDEPLVRLALHQIVDWASYGFISIYEATNGEDALHLMQLHDDIDVIFMDIEMPQLNGIELLRRLDDNKQQFGHIIPIVLSAYSEYEYVREAFVLGAIDYIVKADMDEEHLLPIINKATQAIQRHRKESDELDAEHDQQKVASSLRIENELEEGLRQFLFNGLSQVQTNEKQLQRIHKLSGTNHVVVVIQLSKVTEDDEMNKYIRQIMVTVLKESLFSYMLCRMTADEYVLHCSFLDERSMAEIFKRLYETLDKIRIRLNQYINLSISIGVSEVNENDSNLQHLYTQAKKLAERKYYVGFGQLFFANMNIPISQDGKERAQIEHKLREARMGLIRAMEDKDSKQWERLWKDMCHVLNGAITLIPKEIQAYFVDLLWELGSLLYKRGHRWDDVEGGFSNPQEAIYTYETLQETLLGLESVLRQTHRLLIQNKDKGMYSHPVAKAKRFLDGNFCEDVTLTLVSTMVGVSESYLSKQFAKEVGSNFIQYLTNLRMAEAKRLLEIGTKISIVAEKIGYWNPEHFSRVFKKMNGISPKEYRNTQ